MRFKGLGEAAAWYRDWLRAAAFPLWAAAGVDAAGGFRDALTLAGAPLPRPRRGRTQGRQVYCFAESGGAGWSGPGVEIARRGLEVFLGRHLRPDALLRTLTDEDGTPIDETPWIYDQAFALLGMASLHRVAPGAGDLPASAARLRAALETLRHPAGLFREAGPQPFQANCHMHLLEAALAWEELGEPGWAGLADEMATFALARFIDPDVGFLREFFDAEWRPAAGDDGRLVEPGHQFEWAWLLTRWGRARADEGALSAARTLYDCGLRGVDPARGVAVGALWEDLSVREAGTQIWPQTEFLKAALIMGDAPRALEAANALRLFLATPTPGLWFDRMDAEGRLVEEPVRATALYHILCACLKLFEAEPLTAQLRPTR
ncbi:MAG: AGE family epimerase/isomerase [Phenylobacterium sp.]|uniref:AGE family epimerase/isomerase n=1 Tax=Phenylobacterium sp. TaxID=1871053 RepID=UPI00391E01C0